MRARTVIKGDHIPGPPSNETNSLNKTNLEVSAMFHLVEMFHLVRLFSFTRQAFIWCNYKLMRRCGSRGCVPVNDQHNSNDIPPVHASTAEVFLCYSFGTANSARDNRGHCSTFPCFRGSVTNCSCDCVVGGATASRLWWT